MGQTYLKTGRQADSMQFLKHFNMALWWNKNVGRAGTEKQKRQLLWLTVEETYGMCIQAQVHQPQTNWLCVKTF